MPPTPIAERHAMTEQMTSHKPGSAAPAPTTPTATATTPSPKDLAARSPHREAPRLPGDQPQPPQAPQTPTQAHQTPTQTPADSPGAV